jgi:hypothetical protein
MFPLQTLFAGLTGRLPEIANRASKKQQDCDMCFSAVKSVLKAI